MKCKFTPLNKTFAIQLAKKYNLVQGCFDAESGNFDDCDLDLFTSIISFGIDKMSADNHPLIDIMENKKGKCVVCLYEAPYISENWNDGKLDCYYIEPCSEHRCSSVERFEKYLKEGIENYKKIYKKCEEKNKNENLRNPYNG
jgi:hypothetical protein